MKKLLCLFSLLLLSSCMSGGHMMSLQNFDEVNVGMQKEEMIGKLGKPFSMKTTSRGIEYEYVEKVTMPDRFVRETHYIFLVKDGVIVEKKRKNLKESPFDHQPNSYDMQTTWNTTGK